MKKDNSEDKNKIMSDTKKQIIKNSIVVLLIVLFFVGVFVTYSLIQDVMFSRIWQIVTMVLVFLSIVIFEIAYKKDDGMFAINGIEVLVFACFALTIEYIKTRFNINVKIYTVVACSVFIVYSVLKLFIIYISGRKKLLDSFSDIPEIVKDDTPKKKIAVKRKRGEI